jgi:hypothetical protein
MLLLACHMPPAFSQSDFVVYFEKSLVVPDGLAEGEPEDPLDPPDVPDVDPLPDPVPLFVPDGLLEPEVSFPPPLPPVWAAAIAGARAMTATKSMRISFCMVFPPGFDRSIKSVERVVQQYPSPRAGRRRKVSKHANPCVRRTDRPRRVRVRCSRSGNAGEISTQRMTGQAGCLADVRYPPIPACDR